MVDLLASIHTHTYLKRKEIHDDNASIYLYIMYIYIGSGGGRLISESTKIILIIYVWAAGRPGSGRTERVL